MSIPVPISKIDVRVLQQLLVAAGLDCGPTDGQWGPRTADAVAELARRGVASPDLAAPAADSSGLVGRILGVATGFVGLVEVRQNTTWRDPSGKGRGEAFPTFLRSVGWSAPEAYCAAFAKAVYQAAGASVEGMTLGSVETFENLHRLGRTTREPAAGCVFLMQHGNSAQGHAGIVTGPAGRNGQFPTIEGNTNLAGSREGDGVYAKTRFLDFRSTTTTSLHLLGFGVPVPAKGGQA